MACFLKKQWSSKKKSAPFLMILSIFCFSLMSALVKWTTLSLSLPEIVFFRCLVAALIFGFYLKKTGRFLRGKNEKALLLRSLLGSLAIFCNFYALAKIPLADASMLFNTAPLFAVVFSSLFLHEKISPKTIIFLVISLIGIFIILKPSLDWVNIPSLIAVSGGLLTALAYVTIRHLHATESSMTIAFYFSAVGALFFLPFMSVNFQMPEGPERWGLLGIGLLGTLGQLFMTQAYREGEASFVSTFIYFGVLFAIIWGVLFFNEIPSPISLVGMGIIIVCSIFITLIQHKGQKDLMSGV